MRFGKGPGYKFGIEFVDGSLEEALSDVEFDDKTLYPIAKKIYKTAVAIAPKTKDRNPRQKHPESKNAGAGYRHYKDSIRLVPVMVPSSDKSPHDVPAVWILADRHALVVEWFGDSDKGGQYILTRALRKNEVK